MDDPNTLTLSALAELLLDDATLADDARRWLREDGIEAGDVTAAAIADPDGGMRGTLRAHAPGVVAGLGPLGRAMVLPPMADLGIVLEPGVKDGDDVEAGVSLGSLAGPARTVHALERVTCNLLGRLGGIATSTRRFIEAVAGTAAVICDTRKTTPGLRAWEKYAVRCGGGTLHRLGLHDAALFKDNHLAGLRGDDLGAALASAVARVRARGAVRFVGVEVDDLAQLDAVLALAAGTVDLVLLDNMSPGTMVEAVARRDDSGRGVLLEASGGVTPANVAAIAATGVDRIAVGCLTHGAPWLDVGLDVEDAAG